MIDDLRYAVRAMFRSPGFATLAGLSLALGIGGNAAILSMGAAASLGNIDLPDAEGLVMIQISADPASAQAGPASIPEYIAWRDENRSFESIGASITHPLNLNDETGRPPERACSARY